MSRRCDRWGDDTPEARSADTIGIVAGAVTGSDPAVTQDDPAPVPAAPTVLSERAADSPPRPRFGQPRAYDAADAAAWDRDLNDLAGVLDVLADVERRADELNRRAAELLEGWL